MIQLPNASVLVRTWFGGGDGDWESLISAVETPSQEGFVASVFAVDDRAFDGLDAAGLLATQQGGAIVSFLADEMTLTDAEHPILAVRVLPRRTDDDRPPTPPFRVVPAQLWSVENNINLANMDWQDFTSHLGTDGVYRGFS